MTCQVDLIVGPISLYVYEYADGEITTEGYSIDLRPEEQKRRHLSTPYNGDF